MHMKDETIEGRIHVFWICQLEIKNQKQEAKSIFFWGWGEGRGSKIEIRSTGLDRNPNSGPVTGLGREGSQRSQPQSKSSSYPQTLEVHCEP